MDPIRIQQLLAVLCVFISGIAFLYFPYKTCKQKTTTLDGFLLANQNIVGNEFANTFSVAGVALAGNIAFFIVAHREYGYLMGLGPIFYTVSQLLFLYIFKKVPINFLQIRSLADIWTKVFSGKNKVIARTIAITCAFSCIMTVFAEILVGSEMISIFLPSNPIYKALTFFFLGLVVLGYVSYGGYKAVIKTDGWQFTVLLFTTATMIYFAISSPILNNSTPYEIVTKLFTYEAKGNFLLCFLIWAIWINISGAFTDMALWHRMAASVSMQEALNGFIRGLWKWFAIFMLPMMCFVLLYLKGNHYDKMPEFLAIIQSQSGILGYIIFPMIVLGFASALFSTADTYMIAAMYTLCDCNTLLPTLEKIPAEKREVTIKKYLAIFVITLAFCLAIFYYAQHSAISNAIMPILFAIWGITGIEAPLLIYAIYRLIKKKPAFPLTTLQNYIIIFSLSTGWSSIIYTSYLGNDLYSQLALLISSILVIIAMVISFNIYKLLDICNYLLRREKNNPLFYSR